MPSMDTIVDLTAKVQALTKQITEMDVTIEKVNECLLSINGSNADSILYDITQTLLNEYYSSKWAAELAETTDI